MTLQYPDDDGTQCPLYVFYCYNVYIQWYTLEVKILITTIIITVQPLQIKSAVAVEGLKGYIYIEAYKQTHVKEVNSTSVKCTTT